MKYEDCYDSNVSCPKNFPVQYYHYTKRDTRYVMDLHWHREFELIRVLSGNLKITLDNHLYEVGKGDILLIECGAMHNTEPKDCVYECTLFDISMLCKYHEDKMYEYLMPFLRQTVSIKPLIKVGDYPAITETVNGIFDTIKRAENRYEIQVYSLLYSFFALLYEHELIFDDMSSVYKNTRLRTIMNLIDWIDNNFTEQISLGDLSEMSGMSEKYLCKFFREYTSRSPIDYIINLRIETACRELTENGLSVTKAAFKCGFNDVSYFSKAFKKHKNISPQKFKSKYLTK